MHANGRWNLIRRLKFNPNQSCYRKNFFRRLGTENFSICGTDLVADGKFGYFTLCLDWRWSMLCFLNKIHNRMSALLVTSKHRERWKAFGANHLPICEKPHTRYTTNMRDPTFIYHPLFTQINPYPTAFPYGNGMVLHFYQQQESSTTKTVHKIINKWLKTYV